MGEVTVFQCGAPKDHKCDDDGPVVCGGENEDGTYWTGPDTPTNRERARWGSVTCSVCGMTAMDRSLWEDA